MSDIGVLTAIGCEAHLAMMSWDSGREVLEKVMTSHEQNRDGEQHRVDQLETSHATNLLQDFPECHVEPEKISATTTKKKEGSLKISRGQILFPLQIFFS